MSKRAILIGAWAAITLVGCGEMRMPPSSASSGSSGPTISALGPGCHAASKKCIVFVRVDSSAACGFSFDPDLLKVNKRFKDFVVVWRLPPQYEFRDGADVGDGVRFAKEPPNGEFDSGYATDDDEGAPPSIGIVSKRRFRWVFKNTKADQTYNYLVQFHKAGGVNKPIICDPAISNLGDN